MYVDEAFKHCNCFCLLKHKMTVAAVCTFFLSIMTAELQDYGPVCSEADASIAANASQHWLQPDSVACIAIGECSAACCGSVVILHAGQM